MASALTDVAAVGASRSEKHNHRLLRKLYKKGEMAKDEVRQILEDTPVNEDCVVSQKKLTQASDRLHALNIQDEASIEPKFWGRFTYKTREVTATVQTLDPQPFNIVLTTSRSKLKWRSNYYRLNWLSWYWYRKVARNTRFDTNWYFEGGRRSGPAYNDRRSEVSYIKVNHFYNWDWWDESRYTRARTRILIKAKTAQRHTIDWDHDASGEHWFLLRGKISVHARSL